ncbi:dTDP-4-dehydrorhamnose 3,5-epimerase [Galbibacter sp. EGI 63066]|uniref:dTDP-4-dehydrorhamnose 3,5-epimerase n=1 Tax=Galbibacter sp. EGI 63066 TaxID=2993559 RepID=UPI002248E836|nr:dTDP-4-dehydrorhamnose 3,5-epimerase [Galbibacter sp. EGI 63066]MCX2679754.1 dTDP-4-dehydrorhamnose 3,5-epimerase [Galbibacter sp. EGI 63066]
MKIKKTKLSGCFIIEPQVFHDERGYFFESFNQQEFEKGIGRKVHFVQDNQSFSKRGVVRALHYQTREYAQAKLVRVIQGKVLDIAVDLRKESETFGQYTAIELSAENKKQLFIPRGFAHGFLTLSETSEFFYKCDDFYCKEAEGGIIYNDPEIGVDWSFPEDELIISAKDKKLPFLKDAIIDF